MSKQSQETDIYKLLDERVNQKGNFEGVDVYSLLEKRGDFLRHRPKQLNDIILKKLDFIEISRVENGGEHFILKNPKFESIYKIDERSLFLWELMDGHHTVRDLLLAYYNKYGSFAYEKIVHLIMGLRKTMMLTEHYVDIYEKMTMWAKAKSLTHRTYSWIKTLFSFEMRIPKSDRLFDVLYKYWGRLILNRFIMFPVLLFSFIGIGVFIYIFWMNKIKLFPESEHFGLMLFVFWILNTLVTIAHEVAHGVVCKHYGCQVKNSGMMLYMGMPVAFVDTTDIWMGSSKARIYTSLAGPINDIIWAGCASLALLFVTDPLLQILIFQFAFINFVSGVLNLNPLWELDGYYILMDIIGLPLLRKKSFAFLKQQVRDKFRSVKKWTTEQKWFFGYGVLSFVWLAFIAKMFYIFWKGQLVWVVLAVQNGAVEISTVLIIAFVVLVALPVSMNTFKFATKKKAI